MNRQLERFLGIVAGAGFLLVVAGVAMSQAGWRWAGVIAVCGAAAVILSAIADDACWAAHKRRRRRLWRNHATGASDGAHGPRGRDDGAI